MGQGDTARIQKALALEKIRRAKATEEANRACDAEVSRITNEQAARGILQSGNTVMRIADAHIARAKSIIDDSLEQRRAAIRDVPEIATEPHFLELTRELEQTATTICGSIPQHVARYGGPVVNATSAVRDQEERKLQAYARREVEIIKRETELAIPQRSDEAPEALPPSPAPDCRRVFVVHGRNLAARDAMFTFLRSINLDPIEWSEAVSFTGEGSPFTGQVLERAFEQARAVVVLITGDDLSRLGTRFQQDDDPSYERELTPQARPNVLFEAGMAFGRHPERTILVGLGNSRPFSDVAGRNVVRISNNAQDRHALADRLKTTGCEVRIEHKTHWFNAGDFDSAIQTPDGPA